MILHQAPQQLDAVIKIFLSIFYLLRAIKKKHKNGELCFNSLGDRRLGLTPFTSVYSKSQKVSDKKEGSPSFK